MADVSSDSSTDESFIGEVQAIQDGIRAYQFEPRRGSDESSSADSSATSGEDSTPGTEAGEPQETGRLASETALWCTCGRCSSEYLRTDLECLCCRETPSTRALVGQHNDENPCVCHNEDFRVLCLSEVVLCNVLVGLNKVRADNWHVNPPNNRGLRHAAYRQFTWWAHGKLGPGRRRVIPACVTHCIRSAFPKDQDEDYVGFIHGIESDSD